MVLVDYQVSGGGVWIYKRALTYLDNSFLRRPYQNGGGGGGFQNSLPVDLEKASPPSHFKQFRYMMID
jgi:hypothetical protein